MIKHSFALLVLSVVCLFLAFQQPSSADERMEDSYEVILVTANPTDGFNYPYFLRLPKSTSELKRQYLIVESNNSGVSDNLAIHTKKTRKAILGFGPGPMVAGDLNMPLLMPVFPRSETNSLVYTHALDQDSMRVKEGPSARLDLQLLSMTIDAKKILTARKIMVGERFVMVGFSASGTFSNRFAFLHPDKLLAVVSGAVNAFPMLPVSTLEKQALPYPLGLSDITELTGRWFDKPAWISLPQLIFMGAADDNDALQFNDAYSDAERKLVFQFVGQDMVKRWSKAQQIYLQQNANTTLVTYGQVGHWTDGRIRNDMVNFVRAAMLKDIKTTN